MRTCPISLAGALRRVLGKLAQKIPNWFERVAGAYFMVDKPLLDSSGRRVENFTRVETFGDHAFSANPQWDTNDVHWVKALVDPQSRDVFAFQAQIVPANRVAVPSP